MNTGVLHPDFAEPLNYQTQVLPDSPDAQVAATIAMMRRYAVDDSTKAAVVSKAQEACDAGVFAIAQRDMYFQRDEQTAGWLGSDAVEVLCRPVDVAVLSLTQPVPGDCDCHSMYVAAMLLALGIPCAFVTSAADGKNPKVFSHVYVVAYPDDPQQRIVVDASHGARVGWEAPHLGRYQEWPLNGSEVGASNALVILEMLAAVYFFWGRS